MDGLVPSIHVFLAAAKQDVDGRDKRGHDSLGLHRAPQYNRFHLTRQPRDKRGHGGSRMAALMENVTAF